MQTFLMSIGLPWRRAVSTWVDMWAIWFLILANSPPPNLAVANMGESALRWAFQTLLKGDWPNMSSKILLLWGAANPVLNALSKFFANIWK